MSSVADGSLQFPLLHAIKPEQIYNADLRNLPCVPTLYKHTFDDTTNQLATHIICMKCALHH